MRKKFRQTPLDVEVQKASVGVSWTRFQDPIGRPTDFCSLKTLAEYLITSRLLEGFMERS